MQITPQMRILVCLKPVAFRKGTDGLMQLCKAALGEDPFRGTVFAFRNRRATAVKVRRSTLLAPPEAALRIDVALVAFSKRCQHEDVRRT